MDNSGPLSLIPIPACIELTGGDYVLPSSPGIAVAAGTAAVAAAAALVRIVCEQLTEDSSRAWVLLDQEGSDTALHLRLTDCVKSNPEGYELDVSKKGITLVATSAAGLFYGIQTLRQLLSPGCMRLPCLRIEDAPRFGWRGMHLDVSRHFFDLSFVRRYIDMLARHKINTFHWHLTDDDGWRLQLDSFPELTERGAWRGKNEALPPSYQSGDDRYGGFYTKQEIRDLVNYAAERCVTVVPEIDIPGHSKPVTVCHPELLCKGDMSRFRSVQDVAENLLCAGREETFSFLESVVAEVAELFPSRYIHMGGDERPDGPWEHCPLCAKRLSEEGLKDTNALHGYFMERTRSIVESCGKKMVGWNEIVQGNVVGRSATVMAWQDLEKGIEAAQAGYRVVMAPAQHTYFDLAQAEDPDEPGMRWAGTVTLEKAYDWDPIPGASENVTQRVLGVEGCLWSETLVSEARAEYMAFPRICALAEVAWSPAASRDWNAFSSRLDPKHLARLTHAGVGFRHVR